MMDKKAIYMEQSEIKPIKMIFLPATANFVHD